MSKPVGLAGIGLMGGALAERLLAAGFQVAGFDIDASKRGPAALERVGSIKELAARCERVVVAVFDGGQVEQILRDFERHLVICVTTGEPDRISRLARSHARFVEAPISGTSAQLRTGEATALVAGAAEALLEARDILDAICPRQFNVGAPGSAARAKLAVNLVLQLNRAALAEGLALAESMGLDTDAFLEILKASAARSGVMETKGPKMARRDYAPESRLAQTLKDAELIVAEAAALGQPVPLLHANATLLAAAIRLCGANADPAAIIEAYRRNIA